MAWNEGVATQRATSCDIMRLVWSKWRPGDVKYRLNCAVIVAVESFARIVMSRGDDGRG